MGKLKWYKRDPDAALSGMMELSLEERGAYNTVLDLIYSRANQLPDDDRFVSGWLRCDVRVWKRIRARLIETGKLYVNDGMIHNTRADREVDECLSRAASVSDAARIKGIKSGEARRKNNDLAEPRHEPETNTTTTTTTSIKEEAPLRPPTFGGGDPVQRVGSDETPDAGPPVTAPIPPEPSAAPPAASLVRQASAPEPAILPLLGDQQAQPKPARQKRQAAAPNDLPALTMCPWKTPEDIPRDLHEYARTRGLKPDSVALDFINYWLNRAKNPTNRDWRMVWQTWCRREAKDIDLSPKKVKYAAGTDFL